jgi:hypothetical protein
MRTLSPGGISASRLFNLIGTAVYFSKVRLLDIVSIDQRIADWFGTTSCDLMRRL